MEQIYKGYATFDAMTQTDFFFRTDAKSGARECSNLRRSVLWIIGCGAV